MCNTVTQIGWQCQCVLGIRFLNKWVFPQHMAKLPLIHWLWPTDISYHLNTCSMCLFFLRYTANKQINATLTVHPITYCFFFFCFAGSDGSVSYSTLSVMRVLSFIVAVRAKPLVAGDDMWDCRTVSKASRTSSSLTWSGDKTESIQSLKSAVTRRPRAEGVKPYSALKMWLITTNNYLYYNVNCVGASCTWTGSVSWHSPLSSRSPYSPIHQQATCTRDCCTYKYYTHTTVHTLHSQPSIIIE